MLGDELGQRTVHFDHLLPRTGAGARQVPGQGETATAQVQHVQRFAGVCDHVQQVRDPLHVLELEVRRVLEVDVRLRGTVESEQPAALDIDVGHQLRRAQRHLALHRPRVRPVDVAHRPRLREVAARRTIDEGTAMRAA